MAWGQQIADGVALVTGQLLSDDVLSCSITIRRKGATAWDSELQRNVTTVTDTIVDAIQLRHRKKSVEKANSPNIQVGDRVYLVQYSSSLGTINTDDEVIYDGQSFAIKQVDNVFNMVYSITVAGG